MPLPASVNRVNVIADYRELIDGDSKSVTITYTPSYAGVVAVTDGANVIGLVGEAFTKTYTIGVVTEPLVCTNDPDLTPNPWGTWQIALYFGRRHPLNRTFNIVVPVGSDPINLTTVAPVQPVEETFTIVKSVNNVLPNPTTGNVVVSAEAGPHSHGIGDLPNTLATDAEVAAAIAVLTAPVPIGIVDAAEDLIVGSGDNAVKRLAKGNNGQVLTVVGGALQYADPAASGLAYDPGDDVLALYGYHSATASLDTFRTVFNQNNELWQGTIFVRAGRSINKVATFVNVAGVLGAGGTNGFAITSKDGQTLHYSIDDDTLWTATGLREKVLGGSAIPPQTTDKAYRVQICVQGFTSGPEMLLSVTDRAILTNHEGRSRFAGGAGFQSGPGYNPVTFGATTSGASPLVMFG